MKEVNGYNPSKDPRLIDCRTECGNERCFAKRYGLFAERTCQNFTEPKLVTNADRIRAMDIDHLIEWYCYKRQCGTCPYVGVECGIRDWLNQEAE